MKCKDCGYYLNSAEPEYGFCSYPTSYFPTNSKDNCHILEDDDNTIYCGDCLRFIEDTACLACKEDYKSCKGFVDRYESDFERCLRFWMRTGSLSKEKVLELYDKFVDGYQKTENDILNSKKNKE